MRDASQYSVMHLCCFFIIVVLPSLAGHIMVLQACMLAATNNRPDMREQLVNE